MSGTVPRARCISSLRVLVAGWCLVPSKGRSKGGVSKWRVLNKIQRELGPKVLLWKSFSSCKERTIPISLKKGLACHECVNWRLRRLAPASAVLFSEGAPELGKARTSFFKRKKKKVYYINKII